jgi:catechol 2,3-dioxygenase
LTRIIYKVAVELYWDRREAECPRTAGGQVAMYTKQLDLASLLAEVEDRL